MIRIAPSLLSADFANLGAQIAMCESGGADWLHVDVMDGHFVPNLTFGAKVIETARRLTPLPLDVHLMVEDPHKYYADFAQAGATGMTVHFEACPHLHRDLDQIRRAGCRPGVVINPGTPVDFVRDVVGDIDVLLIMSVDPGYGGQKFIDHAVTKIAHARALLDDAGSRAALEVDGGINRQTIARCHAAGADTFVAGNAIFSAPDPRGEIATLRQSAMVVV
jgi:ribulose-phosphate 3-epimerase